MSIEQAGLVAARLSGILGVNPTQEDFAQFSLEQLIDAQNQLLPGSLNLSTEQDADPTCGLTFFLPVRDSDLLTTQPIEAIRQGVSAKIDLLAGTNSQEMNFYYVPTGVANLIDTDEKVCQNIASRHPEPEKLVATYRSSRLHARPGEFFSAIMADWMFHIPTVRLAEAHAPYAGGTYLYEFAWPSPAFDDMLGACHGLELGFVFDALDTLGLTGPEGIVRKNPPVELARQIILPGSPLPEQANPGWALYTTEQRSVMRIVTTCEMISHPHSDERQAWSGAC